MSFVSGYASGYPSRWQTNKKAAANKKGRRGRVRWPPLLQFPQKDPGHHLQCPRKPPGGRITAPSEQVTNVTVPEKWSQQRVSLPLKLKLVLAGLPAAGSEIYELNDITWYNQPNSECGDVYRINDSFFKSINRSCYLKMKLKGCKAGNGKCQRYANQQVKGSLKKWGN